MEKVWTLKIDMDNPDVKKHMDALANEGLITHMTTLSENPPHETTISWVEESEVVNDT